MFVVSGDIISGVVEREMVIKLRMDSSLSFDLPISSVEMVKTSNGSEVGICTQCRNAKELSVLKSLNVSNRTLEIDDAVKNQSKS